MIYQDYWEIPKQIAYIIMYIVHVLPNMPQGLATTESDNVTAQDIAHSTVDVGVMVDIDVMVFQKGPRYKVVRSARCCY